MLPGTRLREARLVDGNRLAWPSALARLQVEMALNLAMLLVFLGLKRRRTRSGGTTLHGQLFHVYLIAYRLFRFAHEFRRVTPRVGEACLATTGPRSPSPRLDS